MTPQPLMTAQQLADYLGMGRQSVYNLMKRGMPSIKIGASRRFRLADVEAWLESMQDEFRAEGDHDTLVDEEDTQP